MERNPGTPAAPREGSRIPLRSMRATRGHGLRCHREPRGGTMLLRDVRIVSFCHFLQGPAAAQYLADMGADVIKVEPLGGAYERHWSGAKVKVGGVGGFFLCANRNKRSVALDLKHPDGQEVARRLIASADVVMENFR